MSSLIFWILVAICKAIADNLSHHYYKSVFNNKERFKSQFWDMVYSNTTQKFVPHTKYKWDAWHVANSFMIVFAICSAVEFKDHNYTIAGKILIAVIYGVIFTGVFNLFYNKVLNKKNI